MLLLDAVYVNYGGALNLLRYLTDTLTSKGVDYYLLADSRCDGAFDESPKHTYINANEKNRREFYSSNKHVFTTVFCFGNVPPPIRLEVPVYTYFHNVNMLTLDNCRDKKQQLFFWLKRQYIKINKRNTDEWFVQTSNTANELTRHLGVTNGKVKIYPFYKLPLFQKGFEERTDYIFVGEYSGSKGHDELLKAWKMLHEKGINKTLHLTVSLGEEFQRNLQKAIYEGVNIVNHGFIPVEQLSQLYVKSKATVYPSFNESFGLGLVEAMEAGCDVIGSDLPYTYAICKPSEVFNPYKVDSIVEAVTRYEEGKSPKTNLLIRDMIAEMIDRIMNGIPR